MPIDVAAERRLTPGVTHRVHLNHAGAALPTRAVLDAVIGHLEREALVGGYAAATEAADRLAAVRSSAASLLGVGAHEVAVVGSDTQAWTKALWGFVLGGGVAPGQRVLVDRIVYVSHQMAVLQAARHVGFTVDVVPSEGDGTLDVGALTTELDRGDVALVTATHVGTHRGSVNPVAEVGAAARAAGVPYFLDACQSVGQLRVDVGQVGCDVLTVTGRKWLRAPRGTGLLVVRDAMIDRFDPPGLDAHGATWVADDRVELSPTAARFEEFEVSYAAQLGLGVAIDHVLALGIDEIEAHLVDRAEQLRADLAGIEGVAVVDGGRRRCSIVTFTVDGVDPATVVAAAEAAGVAVATSAAAYALLDMEATGHDQVVRVSPHYVNDEDDLARLLAVVDEVAGFGRQRPAS